jgi:putative DNA primase/helicase
MNPASNVVPIVTMSEPSEPDFDITEDGLALRLAWKYSDNLRHVNQWGRWMAYDGVVWKPENTLKVFDLARATCREAAQRGEAKTRLSSAATVASVERLARSDRAFATTADHWDSDPLQLNCASGVIDLTTGRLRNHDYRHYHTKVAGCGLSDKKPELWLQFLDRVTNADKLRQEYLRRWAGYCLTGLTTEHAVGFAYGTGGNGKSVFSTTLQNVLGDYAKSCPQELFCETRNEQHPCAIAALQSVRLALVPETEKGSSFAESRLKALTGGDKIAARFMHQDFFEYTPQFKVLLCGNHKPYLSSVDEAVRRRLHLIPFDVTIPPEERDPRLTEKLRAEYPAILGWAIQGCLEWQRDGLNPPASVTAATNDYLLNEDRIALWIEAHCEMDPHVSVGSSEAWKDYKYFVEGMNEKAGSQRTFKQDLENHPGIHHEHTKAGSCFKGLRLKFTQGEQQ